MPLTLNRFICSGGYPKLRIDPEAMRVIRAFVDSDKLVAAVCHGPWLLVQTDAVEGRQMTSS